MALPNDTPVRVVARGLVRRCGRCGGRHVVRHWFWLQERCPTCGYKFKREEGFFTGVLLINLTFTLGALWLVIIVWMVQRAATGSSSSIVPIFVTAVVMALAVPVVLYPFATTTWAALDLAMRPLEPPEEAEAATFIAARHPT